VLYVLVVISIFVFKNSRLTLDTVDDEIRAGRNVFLKFHAVWCGHCKAMKADWDKLGDEFASSSSVLIGDVECTETEEGKAMCEKFGVKGYPTIKYFVDGDKEGIDYKQGRDLKSLIDFTKETLEIKCDVNNPTECTDKEKDYIEKMKGKTSADRALQLKRLNGMLDQPMKGDLKQWLGQRLHILKSLDKGSSEEEL
jgi:protein disulfide-isomerase A6